MVLQYIITCSIVLLCIGIAAYRIYRTLTDTGSACKGCQLKDTCAKHVRHSKQEPCERTTTTR